METTIMRKLLVEDAKDFAFQAHSNHYFPDGRRYFTHLETVSKLSKQALDHDSSLDEGVLLSTAYLHDTIEDTEATSEDIFKIFGFIIADAVSALTKDKSLPKVEQMDNSLHRIIRMSKEVWVVKMADRIANLSQTLLLSDKKWSPEYKEYYRNEAILINYTLGGASPYLSKKLSLLINIYNRI